MLPMIVGICGGLCLSACATDSHRMDVAAPLPPMTDVTIGLSDLGAIQPATGGVALTANAAPAKPSCGFSSFQRKHTIGYEFDESHHLSFKVSPSFDIWDPSDFETKVSLRFTKALSGPANKRPKCTYGSGFYGLLPYATNEGIHLNGLFDSGNVKSFVEDKLQERENRQKEREAKIATEI